MRLRLCRIGQLDPITLAEPWMMRWPSSPKMSNVLFSFYKTHWLACLVFVYLYTYYWLQYLGSALAFVAQSVTPLPSKAPVPTSLAWWLPVLVVVLVVLMHTTPAEKTKTPVHYTSIGCFFCNAFANSHLSQKLRHECVNMAKICCNNTALLNSMYLVRSIMMLLLFLPLAKNGKIIGPHMHRICRSYGVHAC